MRITGRNIFKPSRATAQRIAGAEQLFKKAKNAFTKPKPSPPSHVPSMPTHIPLSAMTPGAPTMLPKPRKSVIKKVEHGLQNIGKGAVIGTKATIDAIADVWWML